MWFGRSGTGDEAVRDGDGSVLFADYVLECVGHLEGGLGWIGLSLVGWYVLRKRWEETRWMRVEFESNLCPVDSNECPRE